MPCPGYNVAVSYVPDYGDAYQSMAIAFESMGNKAGKNYADGMARYSEGKYDEAITLVERAVAEEQSSSSFYYGLGLVYAKKGDKNRAVAALEKHPLYLQMTK